MEIIRILSNKCIARRTLSIQIFEKEPKYSWFVDPAGHISTRPLK
jgi:hypothetical protein